MSKRRLIDTKFWSDGWIRKLNPLDRYLFLYLLTNEHTNISGIYEIPIDMMAFESGIDERDLEKSMIPRLSPKVHYIDGWIYLKNFPKHQADNESVRIGIEKAKKDIPKEIMAKIKDIIKNETECIQGVDTLTTVSDISESESESELESKPKPKVAEQNSAGKDISEVIFAFKEVNPSYGKWYGNKTQRGACERLLNLIGKERLLKIIGVLPKSNKLAYYPTITTPAQLEDKYSALEAAFYKEKSKLQDKKLEIII